jgi:hypothetical protein
MHQIGILSVLHLQVYFHRIIKISKRIIFFRSLNIFERSANSATLETGKKKVGGAFGGGAVGGGIDEKTFSSD